jgi:hypothetical protein
MSTPTRTRRSSAPATGRFGRSTTKRASARPARRRGLAGGRLQRSRRQRPSGLKRTLSGMTGAVSGLLAKRRSTSSRNSGRRGKAGGLALLAGAAGLAFRNRDRLGSFARRSDESQPVPGGTPVSPDTTGAGPQTNTGAGGPPTP